MTGVFVLPPHASMSMTSEPESEDVTKNRATTRIATTLRTNASAEGKESKNWKSTIFESTISSPVTGSCMASPPSSRCIMIDASPKTVNQMRLTTVGARRTPITNSRIVRPREIRAMNIPTKGAQLVHQPQ